MNATTFDMTPETTPADFERTAPATLSALLPYAALALTLAAFFGNAPAKAAALRRNERSPRAALRDAGADALSPSSVEYPVPAREALTPHAVSPWSHLLRR